MSSHGYQPFAWSTDTYFAVLKQHDLNNEECYPIAQEVTGHLVNFAQNGAILLLHFNDWDTVTLDQTIEGIEAKGLSFVNLTEVLN